jgi:hypothetical protein
MAGAPVEFCVAIVADNRPKYLTVRTPLELPFAAALVRDLNTLLSADFTSIQDYIDHCARYPMINLNATKSLYSYDVHELPTFGLFVFMLRIIEEHEAACRAPSDFISPFDNAIHAAIWHHDIILLASYFGCGPAILEELERVSPRQRVVSFDGTSLVFNDHQDYIKGEQAIRTALTVMKSRIDQDLAHLEIRLEPRSLPVLFSENVSISLETRRVPDLMISHQQPGRTRSF